MKITKENIIQDQSYRLDNDQLAVIIDKDGHISFFNPKLNDEDQSIEQQMFFIRMVTVLNPSWFLKIVLVVEMFFAFLVAVFSRKGKK